MALLADDSDGMDRRLFKGLADRNDLMGEVGYRRSKAVGRPMG